MAIAPRNTIFYLSEPGKIFGVMVKKAYASLPFQNTLTIIIQGINVKNTYIDYRTCAKSYGKACKKSIEQIIAEKWIALRRLLSFFAVCYVKYFQKF